MPVETEYASELLNNFSLMKKILIARSFAAALAAAWFFTIPPAKAQEKLDLAACVKIALENNLEVKRVLNQASAASINERQSKLEYLPGINANINYDIRRGLTNDPTTFTPVTATTRSSMPSMSLNMDLFNGMKIRNSVRRNELLKKASETDVLQTRDQIEILVTQSYLLVISDKENIKISKQRLDLLQEQLARAEKRVDAGVANMEQVYNLRSEIAAENLQAVQLGNQYKSDKLTLLQALLLDPTGDFLIETPEVDQENLDLPIEPYEQIEEEVLGYSPALRSAALQVTASQRAMDITRADRLPRLTLGAAYGSTYSSNNKADSYFDQLSLNEQKFLGFNLSIPIFDRNRVTNNIHLAKIDIANSELTLDQSEIDLRNQLQRAYFDLVAAHSTYVAAKENLTAFQQSFKFAQTSYEAGRTDFYTYLESLNNKNRGEIELINSKYSYQFRKKILDIYRGL